MRTWYVESVTPVTTNIESEKKKRKKRQKSKEQKMLLAILSTSSKAIQTFQIGGTQFRTSEFGRNHYYIGFSINNM